MFPPPGVTQVTWGDIITSYIEYSLREIVGLYI